MLVWLWEIGRKGGESPQAFLERRLELCESDFDQEEASLDLPGRMDYEWAIRRMIEMQG